MTKTSHELLKQEKKENKVIESVKKAGKTSILRYYVLKYCLTTGHFPKTILTRYCNNNRQFYLKKLLKSYLQLIRLKKRKNYSFKNTIYNFCRFKKHLI